MELFDAIDQMISSDVILAIDQMEASGELLATAIEAAGGTADAPAAPAPPPAAAALPAAPGPITNVAAEVAASSVGAALNKNPELLVRGEALQGGGKAVGDYAGGPILHPDTERGLGMGSRNSSFSGISGAALCSKGTHTRSAGGAACEASSNKRKRAADSLLGEAAKPEEPAEAPLPSARPGRSTRRRHGMTSRSKSTASVEPLEQYILRVMRGRGRDVEAIFLPSSELRQMTTEEDVRSFDKRLVVAASEGTDEEFEALLCERGTPNACSRFGEGIMHMLARRGDSHVSKLRLLLKHGASVFVCDDYGRVPLHDAFWSIEPAMETVTTLMLAQDGEGSKLIAAVDCRGATPLNYARKPHHDFWKKFFTSRASSIWPRRSKKKAGSSPVES